MTIGGQFTLFGVLAAVLIAGLGFAIVLSRTESLERRKALAAQSELMQTPFGTVEYAAMGEGPPVLVIHGAGGGFDQGLLLADAVGGTGRRWVAVSRFGYLRSPLPPDASTAAQADALAAFLSAYTPGPVDVLAMSGGVPPALQLAARHPGQVRAMVLLSSAPFTPFSGEVEDRPVPASVYTAIAGSDAGFWTLRRIAPETLKSAFDARPDLLTTEEDTTFVQRLIDGFQPASGRLDGLRNEIAAVDPGAVYELEAIRAPVLVIHAADDRLNPVAISETLAARIPGAEFIRYETGGHLLLGRHEVLRGIVPAFFGAQSSAP
ncbi:alpha/beta fold hydrolase [Hyphomonas sp.]|uniref:alpha/beta fold hydrolase n=1 Tax=Hyphomonas sp. TaxID=87 RepID=UPI00391CB994